jgi:hypothetical protein
MSGRLKLGRPSGRTAERWKKSGSARVNATTENADRDLVITPHRTDQRHARGVEEIAAEFALEPAPPDRRLIKIRNVIDKKY